MINLIEIRISMFNFEGWLKFISPKLPRSELILKNPLKSHQIGDEPFLECIFLNPSVDVRAQERRNE